MLNWTSDQVVPANPVLVSQSSPKSQKPKRSTLPVLVVLFLFAWGLMASLIVEQGRTIQSQRWLIQSLFQDSSQLSHMKGEAFQKQHAAQAQAAQKAQTQVQTPSTQDKNQAKQDPAASAAQSQAKAHGSAKLHKRVPFRPPTDADTMADERRTVLSI